MSGKRVYLVDRACPTRGVRWSEPADVALCLITCGHTPRDAEEIVAQAPAWVEADEDGLNVSVMSTEATWTGLYNSRTDNTWINATVDAARRWAAYRRGHLAMPRIIDVHPTEPLRTPSGLAVSIDVEMTPVIRALWSGGLTTLMSCQDVGEAMAEGGMWPVPARWHQFLRGRAWLKMPLDDAHALVTTLSLTPEFARRLTAKAPDGWDSKVWLGPEGLADYSNIYFPKEQLPKLAIVLAADVNADRNQ